MDFKAKLSQDLYCIRGIAILCIVIGHVIGHTKSDGIRQLYTSDIFGLTWLVGFIYTFHIAVLFIISGISFGIFSRKDASYWKFADSKFKRLVIPLICWAPPFLILQSLSKGRTFSFVDIVNSVIHPYSIFWFIHALIFSTVFSFICFKVFKSKLVYAFLSILVFIFFKDYYIISQNILYTSGVLISGYLFKVSSILGKLPQLLTLLFLPLGATTMISVYDNLQRSGTFVSLFNGVLAFFLAYAVLTVSSAKIIPARWFCKLMHLVKASFLYLGKISLVIYILHIYFGTATRVLLVKAFGVTQPNIHFILGCLAATLGPVIVYELFCKRSNIFRLSLGEP